MGSGGGCPGGRGGPGGGGGPGHGLGGFVGPGAFFGGCINGIGGMISSCLSCLCCCWLFRDCFGGPPGPGGPR